MTILTYKNRLLPSALMGYISPAPHKTGAGIGTPLTIRAHSRASGFFTCKASSRRFIRIMAGRTGEPQGSPGSLVAGSTNPVRLATLSLVPWVGELSQFTTRGYQNWTHRLPPLFWHHRQKPTVLWCRGVPCWRTPARGITGMKTADTTARPWPMSSISPPRTRKRINAVSA